MKKFLIALQFLTIFPIKIKSEIKEEDFGRSLVYFPIVGILIGCILVFCSFLFNFLPHLVLCCLILIISIMINGAIHLDGFADTCDGLYGSRTKEKILEIMKDSCIGAMGAIGIVLLLIFKFTLLASIPPKNLWKFLILMSGFSRWTQVLACYSSNYARLQGQAKSFVEYAKKGDFLIATIFILIVFLLLIQIKGIILFFISILPIFILINFIKKKLDGITGDIIGATSETAEVFILLFGLVLTNH